MAEITATLRPSREAKRRIWGWWWFDWATQPYNTLLITFIFGPYVVSVVGDGAEAQVIWGYGIGAAGILIALLSPVLGAIADRSGRRMAFIWFFSLLYVTGAVGIWWSAPAQFDVWQVMLFFCIGMIGMEFATTFTNAMLPDLAPRNDLGKVSGSGWAWGYAGGVVSLILVLTLLAEGATGRTLIGIAPILGLDPETREGTRAVGPFTAIWFVVFMIPFFLWVRDPLREGLVGVRQAVGEALPHLVTTLRTLHRTPSLLSFLGASMFYRDALNGIFVFGGIYAAGVLQWTVIDVGVFGILATISGTFFAWVGGRADSRYGPKPVILVNIAVLAAVGLAIVFVGRTSVFGVPVAPDSNLPDIAFYILGLFIGAGAGSLQAASRTMMVRQARSGEMTEGFGLYALSGRAVSFLAPLSIGLATDLTGSQQLGILPVVALFLIGLVLLIWVNPEGEKARA